MPTTAKRPAVRHNKPQQHAREINQAFLQLLKAIPVDHLDRRLSSLEKWVTSLEKDLRKLALDAGRGVPRAPRRAAAKPVRRARRATTPRRVRSLPVEREMVRPGA